MNEREEFEGWTRKFYSDLACASDTWSDEKGTYTDYTHHMAWHLWQELQSRLEEINQRVEGLEKENASLKRDAARYRWLRDGSDLAAGWHGGIALAGFAKTNKHKSELDTTIDAAIQVNKGN